MLICNEVNTLVHEPGVTGHKSKVMTSPASRMTWRGFSFQYLYVRIISNDCMRGASARNGLRFLDLQLTL